MTSALKTMGPNGHQLAYHKTDGENPGVLFLGGFMSDMTGSKATTIEDHGKKTGHAAVRFDYSGHGISEGKFADGTIGAWAADALHIFDTLTEGPQILVGSSMGGWIASLIARTRPERIAGFIGIAAAPDFTERLWAHELEDEHRQAIMRDGRVEIFSEYGPDPYVFTKALFDDGREQSVFNAPLKIDAPVRLIHGTSDPDVPWEEAIKLAQHMKASGSTDVEAILVPGGDHRLSTDLDLARLTRIIDEIRSK